MTIDSQRPRPSTISIDPAGAREIDDAIAVTDLGASGWRVDVCIPDVPSVVRTGTRDDLSARGDGLTRYASDGRVRRMFAPETVDRLSLSPMDDRPMVHVVIDVDRRLNARVSAIGRLVHRTEAQISYAEADAAIVDQAHPLHERMQAIWRFAQVLHEERSAATGASFDIAGSTYTTEEGRTVRLDADMAHPSNMAVMEIMILANSTLAAWARDRDLPVLYRNHLMPGFSSGHRKVATEELAVREGLGSATAARRIRSMGNAIGPAEMGTRPLGHHGLDLAAYGWFTSPLRRYCDVVNLRALLDGERDTDMEGLAAHLTATHRSDRTASSEHHAQSARFRIVSLMHRGLMKDLERFDVHTILRALKENPDFDRPSAMRLLADRMAGDRMAGRDLAALQDDVADLFGDDAARTVSEWLDRSPARRLLLDEFRGVAPPTGETDGQNHRGRLQEHATRQRAGLSFSTPERIGPDHGPVFTVVATWSGKDGRVVGEGAGRTVRSAEHAAARDLLLRLGVAKPDTTPQEAAPAPASTPVGPNPSVSAKSRLMEWVQAHPGSSVDFGQASSSGPPHAPSFTIAATCRMNDAEIVETGQGRSKKEAEQDASARLLQRLSRP